MNPEYRTCLNCRGSTFKYNYNLLAFTSNPCGCCNKGILPFHSQDDGFGPLSIMQHAYSTEILKNNKVIGKVIDLYREDLPIDECQIKISCVVISVAELLGLYSLLNKLRDKGKVINCKCCQQYRTTSRIE